MDIKRIIGLNVNMLRLSKDLTQQEFADAIGISKSLVSRIESAAIVPSAEIIKSICTKFNVSADWLLQNDNENSINYETLEVLELYNNLNEDHKKIVINLMKLM